MTLSPGHPNVIAARVPTTEIPTDLCLDATSRALFVALWSWNTSTMAYEKVANLNAKLDSIITLLGDIKTNTTP